MINCSNGDASRIEANPSPTRKNIAGKPRVTPAIWGRVRTTPKRAPDEASMTLLGPGVNAMTSEKIRTAVKVCGDMTGRLRQIGPFEVWRPAHDGYLRRRLSHPPGGQERAFFRAFRRGLLLGGTLAKPPVLPGFFPLACGHGGTVDALA